MAYTIKSIMKLFIFFACFQISIVACSEVLPHTMANFDTNDLSYLIVIKTMSYGDASNSLSRIDTMGESKIIKDKLSDAIGIENLFDDSIIDTFLGTLQVIGNLVRFVVEVALLILSTPGIMFQILIYNFIGMTSYLYGAMILIDIFFYGLLFNILLKRRTSA